LRKKGPGIASSASFSIVGTVTQFLILVKFDEDDLKNSLKRNRDEELEKNMPNSMRAFQSYNFGNFREKNEVISEIIAERIAKETREYYRRSKIAGGTFVTGGTLILAAGATAVYQYFQPPLSLYPIFAGKTFDAMIKKRRTWQSGSSPFGHSSRRGFHSTCGSTE